MVPAEDNPLRDAYHMVLQAIADLKAAGIAVPMSLHKACHRLHFAANGGTPPADETPGQS